MPKNTAGGKKFKKCKRTTGDDDKEQKAVPLKNESLAQEYGIVTHLLGSRRVMVQLYNTRRNEINCNIPKSLKREKMFVNKDSLVLVGTRPDMSSSAKGDVIYLYDQTEEAKLVKQKQIPFREVANADDDSMDGGVVFGGTEVDEDTEIDLNDL